MKVWEGRMYVIRCNEQYEFSLDAGGRWVAVGGKGGLDGERLFS